MNVLTLMRLVTPPKLDIVAKTIQYPEIKFKKKIAKKKELNKDIETRLQ